jgi:hypothetical protein
MSMMSVSYHWHDRRIGDEEPTTVRVAIERDHFVLKLGDPTAPAALAIFFTSSVSAYALASAVMTGAEHLEKAEQAAKDDPERPRVDVPLPLDDDQAPDELVPAFDGTMGTASGQGHVYPVLEAAAREMDAPDPVSCINGTRDECAELGCTNERCPRF